REARGGEGVAVAMELDARPVVLVLESGGAAVRFERLRHAVRHLGEHGEERYEHSRLGGGESLRAAVQREARHGGEITGDEGGAADRGRDGPRRLGDRFEDEALGGTHAPPAVNDALEKVALRLRGPLRQLPEPLLTETSR